MPFRRFFDAMPGPAYVVSASGRYVFVNPAWEQAIGVRAEDVIGRRLEEVHPEADAAQFRRNNADVLARRQTLTTEEVVATPEGMHRYLSVKFPLPGFGDGEDAIGGISLDVTEAQQLAETVRHLQKLDTLGRLVGTIAHDFNNMLTVIQGGLDLLAADERGTAAWREDLDDVLEATRRARELTQRLLLFSRRQPDRRRAVAPTRMLGDLVPLLRRLVGETVTLDAQIAPDLPGIEADPGQLEQVLVNLVVNARDALSSGGRIAVRAAPGMLREAPAVRIEVADTGCGMTPAVLEHAFEPFFTTKPEGQGTGLGLSTSFGIVRQHEGDIAIASAPGAGTTVTILLPARTGAPEPPVASAPPLLA